MAELKRTGYAKRLWDAWKEYEKENGTLTGVQLAALVQARIGRPFDDTKLGKIHKGKRRATVDEHYALAAELDVNPDLLAGQKREVVIRKHPVAPKPLPELEVLNPSRKRRA